MPPRFVSCWTEPHAPSIWLSTPTSMAPGNRPPVGSHNVYGLTESRHSRWSCLRDTIPTAFSPTAAEMLTSSRNCSARRAHELRVDLSGRPQQRAQPVSDSRSARRARGGLDQSLSGPVLRPRLGLAHSARLCLRPDALRALVGRSPLHRRSDRAGSHPFLPSGLCTLSG